MIDSKKMLQSLCLTLCLKGAAGFANSGAIAMTCQRRQATAFLLIAIPLHYRGVAVKPAGWSVFVDLSRVSLSIFSLLDRIKFC